MLYVYYGDAVKARNKVRATVESMLEKNPSALFIRVTEENFNEFDLVELMESQALFKSSYIVLLDNLLIVNDFKDEVMEFMKEMAESKNIFFLLEEKLDTKFLKILDKYATKIVEIVKAPSNFSGNKKERFNVFVIANALTENNKKKLWHFFWKAKYTGISDEEIYGVLFWQVKVAYLAVQSNNTVDIGLKPFVYKNAKNFASKIGEKRLRDMLNVLVRLPHESRRNGVPLEIGLEKFILTC